MNFTYPKDIRFTCSKCAQCCGHTKEKTRHILILTNEAQEIQNHTQLAIDTFSTKIINKQPYTYEMKLPNNRCFFLKPNGCSIYSYRPLICRFYPFELKYDKNQQTYVFTATHECSTLNQGKRLTQTTFKQLFRAIKKVEKNFYF